MQTGQSLFSEAPGAISLNKKLVMRGGKENVMLL